MSLKHISQITKDNKHANMLKEYDRLYRKIVTDKNEKDLIDLIELERQLTVMDENIDFDSNNHN